MKKYEQEKASKQQQKSEVPMTQAPVVVQDKGWQRRSKMRAGRRGQRQELVGRSGEVNDEGRWSKMRTGRGGQNKGQQGRSNVRVGGEVG